MGWKREDGSLQCPCFGESKQFHACTKQEISYASSIVRDMYDLQLVAAYF